MVNVFQNITIYICNVSSSSDTSASVFPDNYKEMVEKKKLFDKKKDIWTDLKRAELMKKPSSATSSASQATPSMVCINL